MNNPIVRYGVFAATVLLGINIIFWLIMGAPEPEDFRIGEVVGYSSIILSLLFIYFGIRNYRDIHCSGSISFWRAVLIGLGIAVLPSLAFGIYNYVYMEFMDPAFVDKYWSYTMNQAQVKMSEVEFSQYQSNMEAKKSMFLNVWLQSLLMFVTVFMIGTVISLISAFVLRRNVSLAQ